MDDPKTFPPQQPAQPQPQPQSQTQNQQQQQFAFRQSQQQLQAAMARFPSNIDAHLRPLGAIRPINLPPNPNLISGPVHPPPNPNLNSLLPKVNRAPPPPPPPPPFDVWRVQSDAKRPSDFLQRDKVTDDTFFSVRDRKVRISDSNAIYALCRSWLRNGYHEESQPQHGEVLKSLPKPLPLPEPSTEKKATDNELVGEDVNVTADSSADELLQGHIKRAKRVRERLREERLRRIKRYKSRLKLLLPPPIEQFRGDTGPS
ncbi:hypothetical protein vseg_002771 [Gypsophila vaccaria]